MPPPGRRVLGCISIAIAVGLLVAGLWPFAFHPANRVDWLQDQPGLAFEPNGIVFDPEPAEWSASASPNQPATFTVELWLEPSLELGNDVFHILTIDDGGFPSGAVLCQWKTAVLLRVRDAGGSEGFREVGVSNALIRHTPCVLTVTTDPDGTTIWLDGSRPSRFPGFTLPGSFMKGRLILGNAAAGKHSWTGRLFGLAAYNQALDTSLITRHCTLWKSRQTEQLVAEPGLAALYLFDEESGQWARDHSTRHRRLFIPTKYQVLQKRLLELPWGPVRIKASDWDDMLVNLLGFVPFGFFVFHYRRLARPESRPWHVIWVCLAGAALSLAIELVQVWLPNRSSSATDLFCNTLGTGLGAFIAGRARFLSVPASPPLDAKPE
jgi:VanZ family protein